MSRAWVSDSGTAVLVDTTEAERHQFDLWSFQEGNPSSPLPKQVQIELSVPNYHGMGTTSKDSWRSHTDAHQQLCMLTQDALDASQS